MEKQAFANVFSYCFKFRPQEIGTVFTNKKGSEVPAPSMSLVAIFYHVYYNFMLLDGKKKNSTHGNLSDLLILKASHTFFM